MPTVAVLDYGTSNLRSVAKALEHVAGKRWRVFITADAKQLKAADRLVFPGQGAIGQCMASMKESGLDEVVRSCIRDKPYLGLCLGLQTLLDFSEEDGGTAGLGVIPGKVRRFPAPSDPRLKIPHMGWNNVEIRKPHPLWQDISCGTRFYFVHSYYVECARKEDIAATTEYIVPFAAAVARDNLFAVQFHPEKSARDGLKLLANFLAWNGAGN